MIRKDVFTREWIVSKSIQLKLGKRQASPELVEKVSKAFHLLECLTNANLDFVFKGGTSLMLLDKPQRFSIDIDIMMSNRPEDLNSVLEKLIADSEVFFRYEEIQRAGSTNIRKQHFKFYYNSSLNDREGYILLDIVYGEIHYNQILEANIKCDFIESIEPTRSVIIPSIDCILGDKLTAFAPNTTGIAYGIGKEQEIIKQLFDIGNLFDLMVDLNNVKKTFISIVEQELMYRDKHTMSHFDVLEDIVNTSLIIAFRNNKIPGFSALEQGIQMIRDYIFTRKYNIEEAVVSASKAAYLAALIKMDRNTPEKFEARIDLKDFQIRNSKYKKLNSIKKFSPEGFFYWFRTIELIDHTGAGNWIAPSGQTITM